MLESSMALPIERIKLQLTSASWNNLFWEFADMALF